MYETLLFLYVTFPWTMTLLMFSLGTYLLVGIIFVTIFFIALFTIDVDEIRFLKKNPNIILIICVSLLFRWHVVLAMERKDRDD